MYKYPGSEKIVEHIRKYGPQVTEELCEALRLRQQTIGLYLQRPLAEGVLVFDKVQKMGTATAVRRYRLPTQPAYDPSRPLEEQVATRSTTNREVQSTFGLYDPADPFGLVARVARGEKVTLPRSASACGFDDDNIDLKER